VGRLCLAHDADDHDRELLDAFDDGRGHAVGTDSADEGATGEEAA
jgi:hypothetical protein